MDRLGLSIMIIVLISSVCGAVLGSTALIAVVLPTAAGTSPSTTTASTVFGWCAVLGGLCNPYSLFTLFTLFLLFQGFLALHNRDMNGGNQNAMP
jgi:hypothetical protein